MAYIDRVKLAISADQVKEMKSFALQNLYDGRRNPTHIPIISYRNGYMIIDLHVLRALFENSIEEPILDDWSLIVEYIQKYCRQKHIDVSEQVIAEAGMWYLELGINILIPIRYCLNNLISKLSKSLTKFQTTVQRKQYVNEFGCKGEETSFYIEKRSVGFYNKTAKELANVAGYNWKTKAIVKWLWEKGWSVLRYEVKMCNSAMVKQTLQKFHIKPTFKDVWDNQTNPAFLAYYFKSIKETIPPAKSKDEILMKQIHAARQANVSMCDICMKVGMDVLERTFGATILKNAFITPSEKIQGKKAEVAYRALRQKRKKINQHFKDKKEYVIRHIENAITQLIPIRVNMETGEIKGVLK